MKSSSADEQRTVAPAGRATPQRHVLHVTGFFNARSLQHAIDLMPTSKDIYDGALVLEGLAQVYPRTSDRDRAIEVVQKLLNMPALHQLRRLKPHPLWAPLRGDPRFEKIVNSLAPKD